MLEGRRLRDVQPAQDYAPSENPADTDDLIEGLFREHYPKIVGMLIRLTGDRGQTEESLAFSSRSFESFTNSRARRARLAASVSFT